jgi:ATP-binding cassette subfamily B protein
MSVSIFETIGIASVLPILQLIINKETFRDLYFFKYINTNFQNIDFESLLFFLLALLVIFFFIKSLIIYFFYKFQQNIIFELRTYLSEKILKNYLTANYKYFFKKETSSMVRNVNQETNRFCSGIVSNLISLNTEIFLLLLIFSSSIFFGLINSLFGIGILFFISFIIMKFLRKKVLYWGKLRQYYDGKNLKILQEIFYNFKEIKLYERFTFFIKKFNKSHHKTCEADKRQGVLLQIPRIILELVSVISFVIILIVLITNYDPKIFLPILGVYAVAIFRIVPSVSRILTSIQNIRFDKPSLNVIYNEIKYSTKNKVNFQKINFKKSIVMKNVVFYYNNKSDLLKKINIKILKNSIFGIVGKTGSGKSTLIEILCGLLKPINGQIEVDGKPINIYENKKWLKKFSYVQQNIKLLDSTVKENIIFDKKNNVDYKLLKLAIKISCLDKVLKKLNLGINTKIGDLGKKLSGGERQRIGIARAIYNKSQIILLDEATNALDETTERDILYNIKKHCTDQTIIFITHKVNNLKFCNNYINLDAS